MATEPPQSDAGYSSPSDRDQIGPAVGIETAATAVTASPPAITTDVFDDSDSAIGDTDSFRYVIAWAPSFLGLFPAILLRDAGDKVWWRENVLASPHSSCPILLDFHCHVAERHHIGAWIAKAVASLVHLASQ